MVKLRKYQQDAVKAIANNPVGIISAATGSGKTTIMAAAIQKQQGSALVLVHTRALVNQTVNRLKAETTNRSVGAFYGEDKSGLGHEILVATWQSMIRLNGKLQFDHIHVDECHNARGHQYGKLVKSISSLTLHGYTATLHGPGEDAVKAIFGEVIYEIGLFDLIQMGYLSKMKVLVNVGPIGAKKYNENKFEIIRETTKNNGTIQKALHFYSQNKRFNEVSKWNLLPRNSYYAVPGNVGRDKREIVFEAFRREDSRLNHLLANRVLNEGIDLPITNTLIFHECVGDFRTVSQRFGRGLRVYDGNDTDITIIMLFVNENKRNQIHAVDELINQVEYESKKAGKKADEKSIRTIKSKTYEKHDNDPTDDVPITISLIDKTEEIMNRLRGSRHFKSNSITLEDFIQKMNDENIKSGAEYYTRRRELGFGSHPNDLFGLTYKQLWTMVRGSYESAAHPFPSSSVPDDIIQFFVDNQLWTGKEYFRRYVGKEYPMNIGCKPWSKFDMTRDDFFKTIRSSEQAFEFVLSECRRLSIKNSVDFTAKYREVRMPNPPGNLNMPLSKILSYL